jgi:hypothetical protein
LERDEATTAPLEALDMASLTERARRQWRVIVAVDESGSSTCPHRVRTWGVRGQTPLIQEAFGGKSFRIAAFARLVGRDAVQPSAMATEPGD